jgi:hypothetical protein
MRDTVARPQSPKEHNEVVERSNEEGKIETDVAVRREAVGDSPSWHRTPHV